MIDSDHAVAWTYLAKARAKLERQKERRGSSENEVQEEKHVEEEDEEDDEGKEEEEDEEEAEDQEENENEEDSEDATENEEEDEDQEEDNGAASRGSGMGVHRRWAPVAPALARAPPRVSVAPVAPRPT